MLTPLILYKAHLTLQIAPLHVYLFQCEMHLDLLLFVFLFYLHNSSSEGHLSWSIALIDQVCYK